MTRAWMRTDLGKASQRAVWGVGGLAASAASTAFVPPGAVPICACAGFATFVVCVGSALRLVHLDDLVFEHRPFWSARQPPAPDLRARIPAGARSGFALVRPSAGGTTGLTTRETASAQSSRLSGDVGRKRTKS